MTRDEVRAILLKRVAQRVWITFDDGVTQSVDVANVDCEGFVHSGADVQNPTGFWARFEWVVAVTDEKP